MRLVIVLITIAVLVIPTSALAASLLSIFDRSFGGPVLFFGFVPFCGMVITVGPPRPMTAIYTGQKYLHNPPFPVPPGRSGAQNVVGVALILNPNIFCPLPIVKTMGISFPSP